LLNERWFFSVREVVNWVDKHNRKRRLSYVEFLSNEWYEAANQALQDVDIGNTDLSVAYVFGQSSHCIILTDGKASVSRAVKTADVTLRQTKDVADELRNGSLSALTAIQEGLIEVEGDLGRLLAAKDAVAAVDQVLVGLDAAEPS
tara:strand:+ start:262 stop:699 length:438 start_codon:yes stop_codon:yes gene_type:complete